MYVVASLLFWSKLRARLFDMFARLEVLRSLCPELFDLMRCVCHLLGYWLACLRAGHFCLRA